MSINYEISHFSVSPSNPGKVMISVTAEDATLFSDQLDLTKEKERERIVSAIVEQNPGLKSEEGRIAADLLDRSNAVFSVPPSEEATKKATPIELSRQALDKTEPKLIEAAKAFLQRPDLLDATIDHIGKMGLVGERNLAAQIYLTGTSRLLPRPLVGIALGSSSSGKSFSINKVASLFPKEAVLAAHRMSPQALVYLPLGSLVHRFAVMGERSRDTSDEVADSTRMWRELIADGEMRIAVTVKVNGKFETDYRVQKGPVAWVESSTLGPDSIFAEDKTRMLMLCADESQRQTDQVLARMALDAYNPADLDEVETIVALHHTVQRSLEPTDVIIPFSSKLTQAFPSERPEARRAFGHLLSGIKAVALLYQFQRDQTESGLIIAQAEDYELARGVFREPLGRSVGRILTAGAQTMLDVIKRLYDLDDTFCASELSERSGIGKSTIYDRLKELRRSGDIKLFEAGSGSVPGKYSLEAYPPGTGFELPSLTDTNAQNKTASLLPPDTRTQTPKTILNSLLEQGLT